MKRTFTVEYGVVWLDESCRDPSSPSAVFRWEGDDAKVLDPRTAAVLALGEAVLALTKCSAMYPGGGRVAPALDEEITRLEKMLDAAANAAHAADAAAGR